MNFKNSFLIFVLICSSAAIAHDHHSLTKEKLIDVLVRTENALAHAEKVNDNLVERNKNLKAQVVCLKAEFDKIKHQIHATHPFYELVRALVHLEKA